MEGSVHYSSNRGLRGLSTTAVSSTDPSTSFLSQMFTFLGMWARKDRDTEDRALGSGCCRGLLPGGRNPLTSVGSGNTGGNIGWCLQGHRHQPRETPSVTAQYGKEPTSDGECNTNYRTWKCLQEVINHQSCGSVVIRTSTCHCSEFKLEPGSHICCKNLALNIGMCVLHIA